MINTQFLDQLRRFNLVINKRVTSNISGPRKSTAGGHGLTFKDYRIYAPGDDIRLIDWKVYARTDNLYLKVHEEEKNLTVHVIIDASNSMDFGRPISKFDYASMIGVGFAYLALKENERFQFATFADALDIFQPKRGMSHLAAMVQHLNSIKPKGSSKFLDTVRQYKKIIGSKSIVILISDFLFNIEEIRESLYTLGKHDIKIIQVLDRVEKELKMEGDMKLVDSETKGIFRTFISQRMRMNYQQQLDDHCSKIEEVCNKLNVDYDLAITDTSIFDTFYKILEG
ncbi:MAG: DUF58 domain-containing protein [Candidatus Woesearchaeota archaeon]|jgi:uncharacterized protein (DUF58 family)|nr:DUF58 domain-containing protein [Candidatus Woesearchaeota archaeon]|tara:strand:+ start:21792 stop:22643 length:852 start_codon:yes stop_codon:yes gene_type:complete